MKFEECKIDDEVTLKTNAVETVNYCGGICIYTAVFTGSSDVCGQA